MNNSSQSRREIGFIVAIVIGLLLGFFIKRVRVGLLIGLFLGFLASGLMTGRERNN
jgi:uncharacterized protein YqgC (DUF456 family)